MLDQPAHNLRDRICLLNDRLRQSIPCVAEPDSLHVSAGVAALNIHDMLALLDLVRTFSDFDAENDPHGEHDFGAVSMNGERYFWKIDYYDRSFTNGSADPTNPAVKARVLTVMDACEY